MTTLQPEDQRATLQAAAEHLIHKGRGGTADAVYVSRALLALGFFDAGVVVQEYGLQNVSAAIIYTAAQKNRYAVRNPGGFVRSLLRNRRSLTDWQRSRIRGFLRRFRSVPEWARARLCAWIGERIALASRAARRKQGPPGKRVRKTEACEIDAAQTLSAHSPPMRLFRVRTQRQLAADLSRRLKAALRRPTSSEPAQRPPKEERWGLLVADYQLHMARGAASG